MSLNARTVRLPGLLLAMVAAGLAAPASAAPEPLHLSLIYSGSLYVKVLELAVEQTVDERSFSASAHIKTSGILALFKKINLKAETHGRIENGVVLPRAFTYQNNDGRKNRRVSATWTAGEVEIASDPAYPNLGDPPASKEQRLEASDPLTVLTRLTLLPAGDKPCQGVSQFFDGKQRYDVEYSYRGTAPPEEREKRLGVAGTVRCGLTYREVAGFKRKPADKRTQGIRRDVTLGLGRLGPNGPWVVSSLRADTMLGGAEIDLVAAQASGARPN